MLCAYGKNYLILNNETKFKEMDKKHFCKGDKFGYQFTETFYEKHHPVIYSLIHNTKAPKKLDAEKLAELMGGKSSVIQEIMGQKPNKPNLIKFFQNEMV